MTTETIDAEKSLRTAERPVFSAYDPGRIALQKHELARNYPVVQIEADMTAQTVHDLYSKYENLDFVPVGRYGEIAGYLRRQNFLAQLSETAYSRELLLRQEVNAGALMNTRVVMLDAFTNLSEASKILMGRADEIRLDPFVVTLGGEFYGTATVQPVMEGLNRFLLLDAHACDRMQRRILEPLNRAVEFTLDFHAIVEPLLAPGGDYADVIELNERFTLAVLFDVCGKGLKAAMMVNSIASVLRTLIFKMDSDTIDLPRILLMLQSLNQMLCVHAVHWNPAGNADDSPVSFPFTAG